VLKLSPRVLPTHTISFHKEKTRWRQTSAKKKERFPEKKTFFKITFAGLPSWAYVEVYYFAPRLCDRNALRISSMAQKLTQTGASKHILDKPFRTSWAEKIKAQKWVKVDFPPVFALFGVFGVLAFLRFALSHFRTFRTFHTF
jgi:hypothetical protein